MGTQCNKCVGFLATVFGVVVLAAGSGFAAPVPAPVPSPGPTPGATTTCALLPVLDAAPEARPRTGARPARVECPDAGAPGRHGAGKPPRRVGRSSQGPRPTGRAERKASTARGRAAKRAVHDGPVVIARRAITARIAAAGSGPVLPLGLAAGLFLVAGGALVLGARRRRPG